MKTPKEFLKDGCIVKFENGDEGIVYKKCIVLVSFDSKNDIIDTNTIGLGNYELDLSPNNKLLYKINEVHYGDTVLWNRIKLSSYIDILKVLKSLYPNILYLARQSDTNDLYGFEYEPPMTIFGTVWGSHYMNDAIILNNSAIKHIPLDKMTNTGLLNIDKYLEENKEI